MKTLHFYNTKKLTLLNQCISLCLYEIGHITKAILCFKSKSFIMHTRDIAHIVKTDSLSKTQLIGKTKCLLCCHLRETYVKI